MALRKGDQFKAAIERSNRSFKVNSRRYFKWEDGEEKSLRFLTDGDELVIVAMHEFVVCHDGTKRSFVCKKEIDENVECELCDDPDIKRREVGYGVAVWREPVKEDGKIVFKTKMAEEVDENGKTKSVPWVGVLQQAPKNFWSYFWAAYDRYGTLCDREYTVKRTGKGMDTQYNMFQENESDFDKSRFDEFVPDIEEMMSFQGSQEYYDRHLHGIEPDSEGTTESKPTKNIPDEDLEVLRRANEEVSSGAISFD